ncbi:GntR family transcriptional regulator [Dactylosporangium sp. CA-139066]|uniref:GntR family transcriptional regulator n=1 Tax=Dactylosporangium sp. CA-139066 TaxID=3239930 RepID=UPI003D93855B
MAGESVGPVGYRRISDDLKDKIEREVYPVGGALPSYDSLAETYGVKVGVARNAVYSLRDEGIVNVTPGIGTEVRRKPSDIPPPPDIPARLDEVAATVQRMSDQIDGQITPDLADLREQLGVLQSQIMDLYAKLGLTNPQQQPATAPRRAGGRTARSA